jgi:SAM-dependent methyltransferase
MTEPAGPYDRNFFTSISGGSMRSARRLLPMVRDMLHPASVLDVGCGSGAWLAEFMRLGVGDAMGVDGDYVAADTLAIPTERFVPRDITQPFDLGRRFDMALCLEVGEHIPNAASATLVRNVATHAPIVVFSAAVPGQGGQDHINEAPLGFWRDLFRREGYAAFDPFRRAMAGMRDVEPWYRNNVLLYVRDNHLSDLPATVQATALLAGAPIPDVSSPLFRLRKMVLQQLPQPVVSAMARTKHTLRSALGPGN